MATESVTNDWDVETELMKAAALADILTCVGTSEIQPKQDTITIVADLLGKAIENIRADVLPDDRPAGTEGNRLGNILADAATLPDSDLAVLQSWLRAYRNGLEMEPDSMRRTSDADVRAINGRAAA
ncbi:hypothetical protein IMW82_00790 [Rhodanobacter sp. B2A1Ga4]|uniref:hypothetical protein n=1 Tax=Rhodanobacter TaxID=75309 RepID=UPI000D3810A9|nr:MULTISPECIES: hypothetical protein [Rhodanobacter]MBQ4853217.1 hypothetical protein [Rhodanobacter sp. B2A1Ga4]